MKDRSGPPVWSIEKHAQAAAMLCLAWLLLFFFFHVLPAADIDFSALFCVTDTADGAACERFPAREHWLTGIFRPLFYWAPIAALVFMAGDLAVQFFRRGSTGDGRTRDELLAIVAFLIGPILIVNGWLKAYSGRPRPVEASIFGGDLNFVAVGDFSGACAANCSFVSGEAAAAGWLLCLFPLLTRGGFRYLIATMIISISIAAPFLRVAMGAHFLSDALLGWLIGAMSMSSLVVLMSVLPKGISATLDRVR